MTAYEDTVEVTGKGGVDTAIELQASVELTGKGGAAVDSGGLTSQALVELTGQGKFPYLPGIYTFWKYRKPITLNNTGSAQSDYQILITLTTANFDYSKCKNDGGDIRFSASDGTTPLSYWIEDWNYNGTSKVWAKVDSIPGGENICLYIYYGNASATSESNGDNTFIFFDDFENNNLDKWTSIGDWITQSSVVKKGAYAAYCAGGGTSLKKSISLSENCAIRMYARFSVAGTNGAFTALPDHGWSNVGSYYSAVVCSDEISYDDGFYHSWPSNSGCVANTWYLLEVAYLFGNSRLGWKDGVSMGTINCKSSGGVVFNSIIQPRVGSGSSGQHLWVDEFLIRKYVSPEPTSSLGEEEDRASLTCVWTACLTESLEIAGAGKFLVPQAYIFTDIDNFLIENWSVSKTIQDVLWKFSGAIDKLTTPSYFTNFIVLAKDHLDVEHIIFFGFVPGADYTRAIVADKATLNAYDFGWYLSSQFVSKTIRITDENTNPADTIKTLLGGANWMSTTGIEPWQIRTVSDWATIKKSFIWNSKTSKWKAIKEICDYTHHVFVVKWRKTANNEYYSAAYFVYEDEIDDYLDLPVMETINNPDSHLMSGVKINDKQEAKYNRIIVIGANKITGTWYNKTEESAAVTSGDELPIEHKYESADLDSQAKVDAKATELYNFFHTIARIYTASFKKRMDLELYQKIKFIGYDKVEEVEMRITGITYKRRVVEDIVEIQFTPNQKLADLRKLMRSMGADFMTEQQRIKEDTFIDLTKIAVGTITEIDGSEATVELEKDEGLVKARLL